MFKKKERCAWPREYERENEREMYGRDRPSGISLLSFSTFIFHRPTFLLFNREEVINGRSIVKGKYDRPLTSSVKLEM